MTDLPKKIRVMVVDDSPLFRRALTTRLAEKRQIEVVGFAGDAFEAQGAVPLLWPDVVTLDAGVSGGNGIAFLERLLPRCTVPVIMVSALEHIGVFNALSAGAADFIRRPDVPAQELPGRFFEEMYRKIVIAAARGSGMTKTAGNTGKPGAPGNAELLADSPGLDRVVIALGASTGGTEATLSVLRQMPAYSPGVLVVQHMPPGFTQMYAQRLDSICPMEVREARDGDRLRRGLVLLAPGDRQMRLVKMGDSYSVRCSGEEKISGHCPSVDALFDSVARSVPGSRAVGVILTGMGRDGASGLLNMRQKGAFTVGQSRESCVVYGMPMAAHDIGAVTVQADCEAIAGIIKRHLNKTSN